MKKIKKKTVIGAVCLLAPLVTGVYLIRRHKMKYYAKAI